MSPPSLYSSTSTSRNSNLTSVPTFSQEDHDQLLTYVHSTSSTLSCPYILKRTMSAIQQNVEAASAKHAAGFTKGHLPLPPGKKYLVLTCMDARIDPAQAFGIDLGDAHVIRNAGGMAVEALRSIVISQQLLGTNEIILVKHTGCGMVTFKNEDAYAVVEKNLGSDATAELKSRSADLLPFPEVEQAVKEDIALLQGTNLVPDSVTLSGWVYEVETGKTRRVV